MKGTSAVILCSLLLGAVRAQQQNIFFPDSDSGQESPEVDIRGGPEEDNFSFGGGGDNIITFPPVEPVVSCRNYLGQDGFCRLLHSCATFYAEIAELSRSPCSITAEKKGVCCVATTNTVPLRDPIPKESPDPVASPKMGQNDINHACEQGLKTIWMKEQFEQILFEKQIIAPPDSVAHRHGKLFKTTNEIIEKAKDADKNIEATKMMVKTFNLNPQQSTFALPTVSIVNTPIASTCPPEPQCPETRYRTMDGLCNNRNNKNWGRAGQAFQRVLPSAYQNGVDVPRFLSVKGGELPSARVASQALTLNEPRSYENLTLLVMQWGQFLDHDITHTPLTKGTVDCGWMWKPKASFFNSGCVLMCRLGKYHT